MDQSDSIIVGHFSFNFDIFIFILLCDLNELLSMFNSLTWVYLHSCFFIFLHLITLIIWTPNGLSFGSLITSNHAVFMYINRFAECFYLHIALFLIDECT